MSSQYAARLPVDAAGMSMQDYPAAKLANARYSTDATVSSVVTLTDNTTVVEVSAAGGSGVVVRWVPSTDTQASVVSSGATSNFDHIVAANTVRRFVVPIESYGVTSIVGANVRNGLYKRIATKTILVPSSSVLLAEH